MASTPVFHAPSAARQSIRGGLWTGPTAGLCPGFVQANVVILPQAWADEFAEFCRLNAQACPLLDRTEPGSPVPVHAAEEADLRTDVPRYRIFINGEPQPTEPTEIADLWSDDSVGFLLGCSFTFEDAMLRAGLPVRHIECGTNVPMYHTNRNCQPAGRFAGPLVVSMRPMPAAQVPLAEAVTRRFPRMHGGPVHVGTPTELGIADLARPDFGDPVPVRPGEVPVFWACGVTPQLALLAARPPVAITHSPGCMFITDLQDVLFDTQRKLAGGGLE